MGAKDAKSAESVLEKVTLTKSHTHAGIEYEAGAEIEVNEADKAWLIANEVIAAPAVN